MSGTSLGNSEKKMIEEIEDWIQHDMFNFVDHALGVDIFYNICFFYKNIERLIKQIKFSWFFNKRVKNQKIEEL